MPSGIGTVSITVEEGRRIVDGDTLATGIETAMIDHTAEAGRFGCPVSAAARAGIGQNEKTSGVIPSWARGLHY